MQPTSAWIGTPSYVLLFFCLAFTGLLEPGISPQVQAETLVGGSIANQTWIKENSPYLVTNHVFVSGNLVIREGVEVKFQGAYVFEAAGRVRAVGTAAEPIRFYPAKGSTGWQGLLFRDAVPGSFFVHTIIEGSTSGGVRITNVPPAFTNCWIINNSTPEDGGGIKAVVLSGSDLILSGCIVTNNTAAANGGGARVEMSGGRLLIDSCQFLGNQAVYVGGGVFAGIDNAPVTVRDCRIGDNRVTNPAGSAGVGGLGIVARSQVPLSIVISRSEFAGNKVLSRHDSCWTPTSYAYMGGVGIWGAAGQVRIENCLILGNNVEQYPVCWGDSRAYGGGLGLQDVTTEMANCVIANNYSYASSWNAGSGIRLATGTLQLQNCTITGNSGTAGVYAEAGSVCTILNSIIFRNNSDQTQIDPSTLDIRYSCVQGGYTGEGNLRYNPTFCPGTFTLLDGSPCIDAGSPGLEYRDSQRSADRCSPFARGHERCDMGAYGGPGVIAWTEPAAAPVIRISPAATLAYENQPLRIGVLATGAFPLSYRWYRDGAPLNGKTNAVLELTSTSVADAGAYTVEISNSLGTVTTSPVSVAVAKFQLGGAGLSNGRPQLSIRNGIAGQQISIYSVSSLPVGSEVSIPGVDSTAWELRDTLKLEGSNTLWTDPRALNPNEARYYGVILTK